MEASQLPALCLGNDCQSGGHTSVVIAPEAVLCAQELRRGWGVCVWWWEWGVWQPDARVWLSLANGGDLCLKSMDAVK